MMRYGKLQRYSGRCSRDTIKYVDTQVNGTMEDVEMHIRNKETMRDVETQRKI